MQELVKVLPASIAVKMCWVLGYTIVINDGKIAVERKRKRWIRK